MTQSIPFLRTSLPIFGLAAFATLAICQSGAAETSVRGSLEAATLVGVAAAANTNVETGNQVVFQNEGKTIARIVFSRRDEAALQCRPDDDSATRSRPGQYLLAGGAEMTCAPEPGSYRYTTFVHRDGGIRAEKGRLNVR
ncbi:MAG: hypothetical protein ABFS46_09705 [Myxococcota bacterium]